MLFLSSSVSVGWDVFVKRMRRGKEDAVDVLLLQLAAVNDDFSVSC